MSFVIVRRGHSTRQPDPGLGRKRRQRRRLRGAGLIHLLLLVFNPAAALPATTAVSSSQSRRYFP